MQALRAPSRCPLPLPMTLLPPAALRSVRQAAVLLRCCRHCRLAYHPVRVRLSVPCGQIKWWSAAKNRSSCKNRRAADGPGRCVHCGERMLCLHGMRMCCRRVHYLLAGRVASVNGSILGASTIANTMRMVACSSSGSALPSDAAASFSVRRIRPEAHRHSHTTACATRHAHMP